MQIIRFCVRGAEVSPQVAGQPGPLTLARNRTGAGHCPPRRYRARRRSTPRRNPPRVTALHELAESLSRAMCTDCRKKGHRTGPECRAVSELAAPALTVLRIRAARG